MRTKTTTVYNCDVCGARYETGAEALACETSGVPEAEFKVGDEVVERANSLEFGLAAYAFTTSSSTAAAIGDALESGMVGVNSIAISTPETPFGGVKESGHGSEGGIEGLGAYLVTKFISQG